MKNYFKHIFFLAVLLLVCCVGFSQIKVNAVLDSSKIRIGEQTKLDLYVTYDANAQSKLKIDWPSFEDTISGKVEIISKTAIDVYKRQDKWIPLYSMVTYSPHIRYSTALKEGARQEAIMQKVMAMPGIESKWDSEEVEKEILKHI